MYSEENPNTCVRYKHLNMISLVSPLGLVYVSLMVKGFLTIGQSTSCCNDVANDIYDRSCW